MGLRPFPIVQKKLLRGIVFTDLDGTLLRSDHTLSRADKDALHTLPSLGIVRVVATGRSLTSFLEVCGSDFPADFVIFSTGAGVASLPEGNILRALSLNQDEIMHILKVLRQARLDFMLHAPIPNNHYFAYEQYNKTNPDFITRLTKRKHWIRPLGEKQFLRNASQFLVIIPPQQGLEPLEDLRKKLTNLNVVRATSPFDHASTWIEIFPAQVSKAHAATWLCKSLGISLQHTMAIGNDYNDLDLLELTPNPFVVANAPEQFQQIFPCVPDNNHDGVAKAITIWMKKYSDHPSPSRTPSQQVAIS